MEVLVGPEVGDSRKNPRVRTICCPQFWGRKWPRQFYGHLEKYILSAGKTHVHKIPPFGGGGEECRFYFCGGARIFLNNGKANQSFRAVFRSRFRSEHVEHGQPTTAGHNCKQILNPRDFLSHSIW